MASGSPGYASAISSRGTSLTLGPGSIPSTEPWWEAEAYGDSDSSARLGTAGDGRGDSEISVGGGELQRKAGERRRRSVGAAQG